MLNSKKIILVSLAGAVVLLGAGCAATPQATQNSKGQYNQDNNSTGTERGFRFEGTTTTVADLIIGKQVMVMGTPNSDGTISATQILLGDFSSFASRFSSSTFSSSTAARNFNQGRPRPGGNFNGQGRDGENNSAAATNRPRRVGGTGRAVGEIIKKDNTSLVLKTENGGSKIIFYSDKTAILIVKPPTSTPDHQVSSSTP